MTNTEMIDQVLGALLKIDKSSASVCRGCTAMQPTEAVCCQMCREPMCPEERSVDRTTHFGSDGLPTVIDEAGWGTQDQDVDKTTPLPKPSKQGRGPMRTWER